MSNPAVHLTDLQKSEAFIPPMKIYNQDLDTANKAVRQKRCKHHGSLSLDKIPNTELQKEY